MDYGVESVRAWWDTVRVDDLVTWLRAQLDADERAARLCDAQDWRVASYGTIVDRDVDGWRSAPDAARVFSFVQHERDYEAEHAAEWDPGRVLAEVHAKRRILDRWRPAGGDPHPGVPCENWPGQGAEFRDPYDSCVHHLNAPARTPDEVVQILALPYADRPGYRDEWRPAGADA